MPQLPDYPIGTPKQLREVGINPRGVVSCSKPRKDGSNPGCGQWFRCREGLDGTERVPCLVGMEKLTPLPGGGWSRKAEIVRCDTAYNEINQSKFNGMIDPNDPDGDLIPQVVQIIARPGQEIEVFESLVKVDPLTQVRTDTSTPKMKTVPMPVHPRELPMFRNAGTASMAAKSIMEQRAREAQDKIVGLAHLEHQDDEDEEENEGTNDRDGDGDGDPEGNPLGG